MPRYDVFSSSCFPVFSPKTGKYRPEKTDSESITLQQNFINLVYRIVLLDSGKETAFIISQASERKSKTVFSVNPISTLNQR